MFRQTLIFATMFFLVFSAQAYQSELGEKINSFEQLFEFDYPFKSQDFISIAEEGKDRIIIAGDSWAAFPCGFQSMEKMIQDVHADFRNDPRCRETTKLGMDAVDWLGSSQDKKLTELINKEKRIKYIYLSLGGNDVMAEWNINMTPAEELALTTKISSLIKVIMDRYLAIRPDIKIILSGYDYPHFKDNHMIWMYRRIYNQMGKPSAFQINSGLIRFSQHMIQLADHNSTFFIHHLGLAHYYDGVGPTVLGLPTTKSPDEISPFGHPEYVGGDVYSKSREESMMLWGRLLSDAFHLNEQNYYYVMLHTYKNLLAHITP